MIIQPVNPTPQNPLKPNAQTGTLQLRPSCNVASKSRSLKTRPLRRPTRLIDLPRTPIPASEAASTRVARGTLPAAHLLELARGVDVIAVAKGEWSRLPCSGGERKRAGAGRGRRRQQPRRSLPVGEPRVLYKPLTLGRWVRRELGQRLGGGQGGLARIDTGQLAGRDVDGRNRVDDDDGFVPGLTGALRGIVGLLGSLLWLDATGGSGSSACVCRGPGG